MYDTPSSSELRDFLNRHNLTGSMAGKLVGVDSRSVRRWTAPEGESSHKNIPWASWCVLRLLCGEITVEGVRAVTEAASSSI